MGNENAKKQLDQNDPVVSTAAKIAKEYGVSEPTIKRDEKFAKAVDIIGEVLGHGDQKSGGQNDPPIKTAEKIAAEYGVSEKTIKRDEKFSQAVDVILESR